MLQRTVNELLVDQLEVVMVHPVDEISILHELGEISIWLHT